MSRDGGHPPLAWTECVFEAPIGSSPLCVRGANSGAVAMLMLEESAVLILPQGAHRTVAVSQQCTQYLMYCTV